MEQSKRWESGRLKVWRCHAFFISRKQHKIFLLKNSRERESFTKYDKVVYRHIVLLDTHIIIIVNIIISGDFRRNRGGTE